MSEPTSDLTALQSESVLKASRHITRIAGDDQGAKASLAASSGKSFLLTSNVVQQRNICVKNNSLQETNKPSLAHFTKKRTNEHAT